MEVSTIAVASLVSRVALALEVGSEIVTHSVSARVLETVLDVL